MMLLQQLNKFFRHPAVLLTIRILVGGVFIVFAVAKAFEPKEDFYSVIATYQMLPNGLIPYFGMALIIAELIAALGFILGFYLRWSGYALLGLLVMFMIAIAQTMFRGIPLTNCGCSGAVISLGESASQVLVRDAAMLVGVVWVLLSRSRAWTLDLWLERDEEMGTHTDE